MIGITIIARRLRLLFIEPIKSSIFIASHSVTHYLSLMDPAMLVRVKLQICKRSGATFDLEFFM